MSTYFATNFTIDVEPMERLRAPLVHNLFIHLSDQTFAHKRLVDRLVANIDVCRDRGIELIGRANFTEPSFEPVKRWFDFLESHDIKRLNVALTIPSAESTNTYIDLQTFSEYIPTLVEAIEYSRSHGFELSFAKPVPPCLFPEKYHDELLNPKWGALFCNISEDDCMRNLNLSPDMQFTPCLGLPTPGREFSDDVTWDELAELFRPTVMRLSASPSMERCRDCYLWRKRLCQGACLSYKR